MPFEILTRAKVLKSRIIKAAINLFGFRAEKILNDPDQIKIILDKTKGKMNNPSQSFDSFREELFTLYEFAVDYFEKNYRDVSIKSIFILIFALVYFVIPSDIIPDLLLGIGYIDDSIVILWSYRAIKKEVLKYKEWKADNTT